MRGQTLIISASIQEALTAPPPQGAIDPERQQEAQHWYPSCQHHLPAFGHSSMGTTGAQKASKVESRPQTSP